MPLILRGSAIDLNRKLRLGTNPIDYVMLNLPYRCNYRCLKCCNWSRPTIAGDRLMVSQITEALKKLRALGARVLVIAGEGEPTIDLYFREIVDLASDISLIPYIFTNGSMIDEDLAGWLASKGASLIINIDAFDGRLYDELTGARDGLAQVLENLASIRRNYRHLLHTLADGMSVTSLAINTVLSQQNLGQVERIRQFCSDEIVFVVNEPIDIGRAKRNWQTFKDADLSVVTEANTPLGTLPGQPCSYLRHGISIGADGSFLPCAYALETAGSFGNVLTDDIADAHKTVLDAVHRFYAQCDPLVSCYGEHVWPRCLLRHPRYQEFVEKVGEKHG